MVADPRIAECEMSLSDISPLILVARGCFELRVLRSLYIFIEPVSGSVLGSSKLLHGKGISHFPVPLGPMRPLGMYTLSYFAHPRAGTEERNIHGFPLFCNPPGSTLEPPKSRFGTNGYSR